MKKTTYMLVALMLTSGALTAQNEVDALRYSMTDYTGTARSMSMGGAFGALGGDLTTLSTNPAGIGVFRTSSFVFTPAIASQNSDNRYLGTSSADSDLNFNFGNLGYVNTWDPGGLSKWKSLSFGIGFNRMQSFNSNQLVQGRNTQNSFLDVWTNELNANQTAPEDLADPFGADLAWFLFLLDTAGTGYFNPVGELGVDQVGQTETSGSRGETVISFGGNYNHRLYLGATIGITNVDFDQTFTYAESSVPNDSTTDLVNYEFRETLRTTGNGFNLKLGFIYRIQDHIRVGGAIHTPTAMFMTDNWQTAMSATYSDGWNDAISSPEGLYEYRVVSPFRAIGSFAYVFAKSGLLSIDYEFVDYGSARLRAEEDDYPFTVENDVIGLAYKATGNLRIGTEYRLNNAPVTVRAGFVNYGNPYDEAFNNKLSHQAYSLGLGLGNNDVFFDLAYVLDRQRQSTWLYDPGFAPEVTQTNITHHVAASVGFRF